MDDDVWVIKVSSDGDVIWQRSYGLNAVERGIGAVAAADGGLVVAGTMTGAPDGIGCWFSRSMRPAPYYGRDRSFPPI